MIVYPSILDFLVPVVLVTGSFLFVIVLLTLIFSENFKTFICLWAGHEFEERFNSHGWLRETVCLRCGKKHYHYPPTEDFE